MANCGDCKNCKCDKRERDITDKRYSPNTPIAELLAPPPKPRSDATSLDEACTCDDSNGKARRSQCWPCIQSYAHAVGYEVCFGEAAKRSGIAKERLLRIANEMKLTRRLTTED